MRLSTNSAAYRNTKSALSRGKSTDENRKNTGKRKPENRKNCAADCGNRTGQTDGTYESPENRNSPACLRSRKRDWSDKNCGYTLIYRNGRKENRLEQVLTEHSFTIRICGGREIETVCTPRHLKNWWPAGCMRRVIFFSGKYSGDRIPSIGGVCGGTVNSLKQECRSAGI